MAKPVFTGKVTRTKEITMLMRIMRNGNQYDYVKNTMLERLIKADGLLKFKRRTGWVTVGTDPTRNSMNDSVENNNRRRESDESSSM
jgi:hypothetical protein